MKPFEEAAGVLFDLLHEADTYLYDDPAVVASSPSPPYDVDAFERQHSTVQELADRVHELFVDLNADKIVRPGVTRQPRFALIQHMVALVGRYGNLLGRFAASVDDYACSQAELWFEHSLNRLEQGITPQSDHRAAIVLYDVEGRPCAFQKDQALSTAYVWRDCVFVTDAGEQWLPAGMLIAPFYSQEYELKKRAGGPHIENTGKGLVSWRAGQPVEVGLLRFSAAYLPPELRRPYLTVGAIQVPRLQENFEAACRLTNETVGQRVGELLRQNRDFVAE